MRVGMEVGRMPMTVDELRRRCRRRRRRSRRGVRGGRYWPRLEASEPRGLIRVSPHPLSPPVVTGLEHILILWI